MPDTPSKFQKNPFITFWVILLTARQTDRQTDRQTNKQSLEKITFLAEVTMSPYLKRVVTASVSYKKGLLIMREL